MSRDLVIPGTKARDACPDSWGLLTLEATCPVCGRSFRRTADWGYLYGDSAVCGYACMRTLDRQARPPDDTEIRRSPAWVPQIRERVLALIREGRLTDAQISRVTGVTGVTIRRWRQKLKAGETP